MSCNLWSLTIASHENKPCGLLNIVVKQRASYEDYSSPVILYKATLSLHLTYAKFANTNFQITHYFYTLVDYR